MKLHTHIVFIYVIMVCLLFVLYQRQQGFEVALAKINAVETANKETDTNASNEIQRMRLQIVGLDAIADKGNAALAEAGPIHSHLRSEIHKILGRLEYLEIIGRATSSHLVEEVTWRRNIEATLAETKDRHKILLQRVIAVEHKISEEGHHK